MTRVMKPIKYSCFFFLFILSVFLFSSCNTDDDDSGNCTDSKQEYIWTQNQSIELETKVDSIVMNDSVLFFISEYSITDGEDNLFNFKTTAESCRDIADSGGTSDLFILVPADSTESFSYRDQEILQTSAFLQISAFGVVPLHSVEEGAISGVKLDEDSWRVSIDVVTSPLGFADYEGQPERIVVEEIFFREL